MGHLTIAIQIIFCLQIPTVVLLDPKMFMHGEVIVYRCKSDYFTLSLGTAKLFLFPGTGNKK